MSDLPRKLGLTVVDGPHRVGSELRWNVRDQEQPAVLGQLLPELAHDVSVRRRYVRDVERLLALESTALATVRRVGPDPDPCDPQATPPWRLRDDPEGEPLEQWLRRRAPLPIDEAAQAVADLAQRLDELHAQGAVLRDLNPATIMRNEAGEHWFTDIGLARVDVLSTRTAASLIVEGSPYAAPELLARTVVDQRADIYGLGILLFRALTGELPFGDTHALLRPPGAAPRARSLRADLPAALDDLVARCLEEDPAARPGSATELADALAGRGPLPAQAERVPCQSCDTPLRPGQRLCTHCGKLAVQFVSVSEEEGYDVELRKIDESAESRAQLHAILAPLSDGPLPPLNFLVGDGRMYSKEERKRLQKLPAKLVTRLSKASATTLHKRMERAGLISRMLPSASKTRNLRRGEKTALGAAGVVGVLVAVLVAGEMGTAAGLVIAATIIAVVGLVLAFITSRLRNRKQRQAKPPLVAVRPAPAALPASDPLVARLGALLQDDPPADLREQVGELALQVQRLVDHRARNRNEAAEIDAVTAPVAELVQLIEAQVTAIKAIDKELATLDEGALVRELAAIEARGDSADHRETVLVGLDRLRTLEDTRSRRFHALLDGTRLARRAVELGLAVHDADVEHERHVALALASLESSVSEA